MSNLIKLGELCHFINGGAWSDKEYISYGIPVIKVTNCKPSGFELTNISYLPYALEKKYIQNRLQLYDLIIATVGSHPNLENSAAGRTIIVNSLVEGFYLNQNAVCVRSKDNEILDQKFLGYYSKYYLFKNYIQMKGRGAANQMRIAISSIKEYPMPLLPIFNQRRIAEILSRYDSLIENYQKQIKLLEESAQRLYKEWFVDLRFPGHENTKFVDGVPEGWEKICLGELVCFKRGKTITKKEIIEGNIPVVAGGIEPAYYCNKSNTRNRVVTISASGANAGYTRMYFEKIWASDCSFIDCSMTNYFHFVYCYLIANKIAIDNLQKGAAQPHVYPKDINALALCCPHNDILDSFESKISYYFDLISSLQKQIHKLTEARDRLLPKLMSVKIEV
ncbi:restriction endonuclease subunit S [uncultured Parabacteroides sp.]|uniref:restriction endonuclease subunit S n=1 Tax=uncultured Parabacteroides sp. TaxID=512312 RepID=UPI002632703E|nr:restriction endonuclease subunit S [uncultured Parabacteroides sp.]